MRGREGMCSGVRLPTCDVGFWTFTSELIFSNLVQLPFGGVHKLYTGIGHHKVDSMAQNKKGSGLTLTVLGCGQYQETTLRGFC